MKYFERRYHCTWAGKNGSRRSPLSLLGSWIYHQRSSIALAPRDLLIAAAADIAARLPGVAAREPTRRHRKHFVWLFTWHVRIQRALETS